MLIDKFERKFYYLRLSLTDACNFKCQYCLPEGYQCSSPPNYLQLTELQQVVSAFAQLGTNKIRLTGGEPSLRKDLSDCIAMCSEQEGIHQVALTTNGYKLASKAKQWRAAGLTHLNLSVDSLDPKMFQQITGTGIFNKVMDGLDVAMGLDFTSIKLNAVLLKGMAETELNRYLQWIKSRPVEVRFIELMQTGLTDDYFKKNHQSGALLKEYLLQHGWEQQLKAHNAGPAEVFAHSDYAGKIGLIMPYAKDFCASCNRLRVSSLGKLHLCLFGEEGLNLRDLLQSPDQQLQLQRRISSALADKKVSHFLQDGNTGSTPHLASIGG